MESPSTEGVRPLRRDEYDKLIELGMFVDEKIELLEGALVPMSPIGPPHSSAVQLLGTLLLPTLAGRATVRIQSPFAARDLSEPEPDVSIVPVGVYNTAHPDSAFLIIEVAETSLGKDRVRKGRIYAQCGVPEYWIVNLVDRCIEVYTEPSDDGFGRIATYRPGDTLTVQQFSDVQVRVDDVIR